MRCCKVIQASEEEKIVGFQVFKNKEILYISKTLGLEKIIRYYS